MVFYILLNQLEDTNVIYSSVVAIITINMVMVILQFFGIDPLCFDDVGKQNSHIVGIFGHSMNLSAYMSIVLPYVWHKNKWFGGMALILVFAPGGLDLASKSWAGILCAIIGMSIYFWFKNRRITVIVLATLLVVGSILTTVLYLKLPEGKREVVNRKVTLRLQTQYPLVRVALSRPYFGHGPGTFQYIIPQVPELEFTQPSSITGKPSMGGLDVTWNDPLGCALEIGIFSLLIFFGIIRKVFRQFRHDKSTETVALFASLATIPIGAFFHSYMNYFNVGMICLALYAMWNIKTERVENEN